MDNEHFWYLDAVEEALCFGWIDSTIRMISGKAMQRFSPRRATSGWTELNKERVRRLEKLGLMTEAGRAVLPPMGKRSFNPDKEVVAALKAAGVWSRFRTFHPLYQRIRLSNLAFCKVRHPSSYARMLSHVIEETRKGRMYGSWNDYGRLLDYQQEAINTPSMKEQARASLPVLGFLPAVSDCDDKSLIRFLFHKKLLGFRQRLTHIRIAPFVVSELDTKPLLQF